MMQVKPEFVELVPKALEDGVLYISMKYRTASHNCCCGCGKRIVTPISPAGWIITYDGRGVSLDPSIGNWSSPCQSHYFIWNNHVEWMPKWSKERIRRGYKNDMLSLKNYFKKKSSRRKRKK